MENILNYISEISTYISIGLIVFSLIVFIMLIAALRRTGKLEKKYQKLMRGTSSKNLEELIISQLDKVELVDSKFNRIKEDINNLDNRLMGCLQKHSMLRYRAFENVGSDLSFSIALLDKNNNGILLTGIYGRSESTTYAKPIDKGLSRYELSQEEAQVLKEAIGK